MLGEELIAKWDSYKTFVSYNGANCDFSNFTQATDDCWLCDPCDTSATSEQRCPWINDGFAFGYPRVVSYNGSPLDTEPTLVLESHFTSGCSARGFAPVPFTPTDNAIYGVLPPKLASASYKCLSRGRTVESLRGSSRDDATGHLRVDKSTRRDPSSR